MNAKALRKHLSSLILDHVGWLLIMKKFASLYFVFLAHNSSREVSIKEVATNFSGGMRTQHEVILSNLLGYSDLRAFMHTL